MANVDNPSGLTPVRYLNGAPYNGQARAYYHVATDAAAIYIGSPVSLSADGSNAAAVGGFDIGTLGMVKHAAAGGSTARIVGVCVAVDPLNGAGSDGRDSTIYCAASTERVIWVADDPNIIFEIQEDNDTSDLAAADVNTNADLIATSAGSDVTGLSGWELDSSSKAVTATLDCHIISKSKIPGNELGAHCKWDVTINLHQYSSNNIGI